MLSSGQSPLRLAIAEPVKLGGGEASTDVKLVWQPCVAFRSPLYPFWLVKAPLGNVYVDQQGTEWKHLDAAGRGGTSKV